MRRLADLHCHALPGIDDGAKTVDDARKLLEMSADKGILDIVFTPHFYPERIGLEDFVRNRQHALEEIRPVLDELGILFRLGAEVQITPVLASLSLEQLAFSGTNYLLLELLTKYRPHDVYGLIHRVRDAGYVPVLSHVERYPYVEEDPVLLYQWVKAGALAQVNAGEVQKDRRVLKRVVQYDQWNLIHLMASDMHSVHLRPQNLLDGYSKLPEDMALRFQKNAEILFQGDLLNTRPPIKPVRRWGKWK